MKDTKIKSTIAKGQLWKCGETHIEIVEVGKRLAHYRLFTTHKKVPTKLVAIPEIQAYLMANRAKLVTS